VPAVEADDLMCGCGLKPFPEMYSGRNIKLLFEAVLETDRRADVVDDLVRECGQLQHESMFKRVQAELFKLDIVLVQFGIRLGLFLKSNSLARHTLKQLHMRWVAVLA
jgi:hypothetical protein